MKNITPCTERNAIKVVSFALEFDSGEVNDSFIQKALDLHKKDDEIKNFLPRVQIHTIQIHTSFNLPIEKARNPNQQVEGVTFDRLRKDGTSEWAVSLTRNAIIVNCGDYTRWDEVSKKTKEYLEFFLPCIENRTFNTIILEYIDEFLIDENTKSSEWIKELFNQNSKYLPSNIYSLDNIWHCHQGFFIEDANYNTLNNINIDSFLDEIKNKKIHLRTQHRTWLNASVNYNADALQDIIFPVFGKNHELNKQIVSNILSEAMCREIGLGA